MEHSGVQSEYNSNGSLLNDKDSACGRAGENIIPYLQTDRELRSYIIFTDFLCRYLDIILIL